MHEHGKKKSGDYPIYLLHGTKIFLSLDGCLVLRIIMDGAFEKGKEAENRCLEYQGQIQNNCYNSAASVRQRTRTPLTRKPANYLPQSSAPQEYSGE